MSSQNDEPGVWDGGRTGAGETTSGQITLETTADSGVDGRVAPSTELGRKIIFGDQFGFVTF